MTIIKIGAKRGEEFNFFYQTFGNGIEKVILIHGFLTQGNKWKRQIEFLEQQQDFEICIFDNRGVGQTDNPKSKITTKEMALDVVDLMDHLGWSQAHVVGASMGGMIALELAHHAPKRIKSLVLAVTGAGDTPPMSAVVNFSKSMIEKQADKKVELFLQLLHSPAYLAANRERLMAERLLQAETDPEPSMSATMGHLRAVLTHKVSSKRLADIKASKIPILVVTGSLDNLVKTSNSYHLSKALQPVDFIVYNNCGHAIHIERTNEFNNDILKHMRAYSFNNSTPTSITTSISSTSHQNTPTF
ncbi:hypothetical protein CYY_003289 [Polysphondylium violaceum]|uniref:AB hydrolase-1 domain-containing protein n=1 Tax=Polysphondylium violaceum TaxID=133409 RepID=A0A8J4PXX6_9MYCE|nr:hypothetical protein CYY_003289 [Polysphondylium violaceum]